MIKSMTGYGKSHFSDENLNLDIEIKTVNSRYLDINIKMPNQLNFLEDKIIKIIKTFIKRGRVDVFIRSKNKNLGRTKIIVNEDAVIQMTNALRNISKIANLSENVAEPRILDILSNSDILSFESEELDEEYLINSISKCINDSLSSLINMREIEGENLYTDLISNINYLESKKNEISAFSSDIKNELKEKIYSNLKEFLDENKIDKDRLANEIIYYADKLDINEELTRLDSHFYQFKKSLDSNESIGKKLDFITQELLRETNTIVSKSSKIEINNLAIEMKTVIEKIKEQVQNVE